MRATKKPRKNHEKVTSKNVTSNEKSSDYILRVSPKPWQLKAAGPKPTIRQLKEAHNLGERIPPVRGSDGPVRGTDPPPFNIGHI